MPSTQRRGSKASIGDVAAAAGVSVGTVSHVLNHPDRVRRSTRDRVLDAIERLGYVRNANASSLAAGVNRTIALVVIDIGNSLFVDIARGVQRMVDHDAFGVVLANSDNDDDVQARHLEFFCSARVGGILLAPMRDPSGELARARHLGTPMVVMNYRMDESDDHCSVLIDNEAAGYIAARHMIELGHRHVAFVGGSLDLQPVSDRRAGVLRAVAETSGVRVTEVPTDDLNAGGGDRAGRHLVGLPAEDRPTGIIAVTDLLGMAIARVAVSEGLVVPDDLAVMGCDYNSNAWGGTIPLTSVRMCGEEMGAAALRVLLDEIGASDLHTHRRVVLTPSLVERESTVGRFART
jgi:LacI family transcriptional regulator